MKSDELKSALAGQPVAKGVEHAAEIPDKFEAGCCLLGSNKAELDAQVKLSVELGNGTLSMRYELDKLSSGVAGLTFCNV